MITNIEFKEMHNIGVNKNGKFSIKGNLLSTSDIPFVMFNFEQYNEEHMEFIRNTMEKFDSSTAIIKLHCENSTPDELDEIHETFPNSAVLLYVNIFDEDNGDEGVREEVVNIIRYVTSECSSDIDKICLIDKTTTLDMVGYNRIVEQLKEELDYEYENFGICESPLSNGENSCLSAEFARELLSIYSEKEDGPLPSANHQKGIIAFDGTPLNIGCGCIQYIVITEDSEEPVTGKSKSVRKNTDNKEKKQKVKKSAGISFGKFI